MRGVIRDIDPEQVHLAVAESRVLEQSDEHVPDYGKSVNIKTKRGVVKPRTPNQAQYIAHILDHDITFGIGPAGPENLSGGRRSCGCPGASGNPPHPADPPCR